MKKKILAIALAAFAPCVFAVEPFCDTGRPHPIDLQFESEMAQSGGVTVDMRNAQGKAHEAWDNELNREYRELMATLSGDEKDSLREAQRAWLSFRDAEQKVWWLESISGDGTLQPVIVSDFGSDLLRARVCQLARYKRAAAR